MKSIKHIFIISLSIIIISVNIATFAIKPIQAKAAVAVPVAVFGSVVWDLLITAFVAVGVYDIVDDYDKQKMVYDDFLQSSIVLDPPLPDSLPDITLPNGWDDTNVTFTVITDFFTAKEKLVGWQPPVEPPDNNSWKGLPPIEFVLGASMLAKITDYVKSVYKNTKSEVHKELFPATYYTPWTGKYDPPNGGMYSYYLNYIYNVDESYIYNFSFSSYPYDYRYPDHVVGVVNPDGTTYEIYSPVYSKVNEFYVITGIELLSPDGKDVFGSTFRISKATGKGTAINLNVRDHLPLNGFNSNFPMFYDTVSALSFLQGGVTDNVFASKSAFADYDSLVANLPAKLQPLIRPDVAKPLSTDTLVNAITDVETKLQPELEKVTQTGTQIEAPVYDKIFTDSLNDAITKTETETKPDPKPDPPVTKPDVEQGNPDDLLADLKSVFPFCIPFDLIHAFSVFQADAKPPRFELPLKALKYGIDYTFVIDLEIFDPVAKIFRTCETISFIVGLILVTRKLIKG